MEYKINGFKPEKLFHYFEDISAIPRGSGNERQICAYLKRFAEERGLDCHTDNLYNVIIQKPGQNGGKYADPVMLQGHLDMVCEKTPETIHDFQTDGIELIVEGNLLRANGTTLGADNGVAVAVMMALLDDTALTHPPLECVFTTQEETGLCGAAALDTGFLSARTMINLDSEEMGVATVSCAGGLRSDMRRPLTKEIFMEAYLLHIVIGGLAGGHSGMDIHLERGNANKLMGRLLAPLIGQADYRLVTINGGNKDNAIPRDCTAVLAFGSAEQRDAAHALLAGCAIDLRRELVSSEPDLTISLDTAKQKQLHVLTKPLTEDITKLIYLAPDGARKRNVEQGGFVVSSLNLSVIQTTEQEIIIRFAPRSSVASLQDDMKRTLGMYAGLFGFALNNKNEYPGWSYREHSPIREIFQNCYRKMTGKELQIEAIHAGLECGIFSEKLPGLDAIAVGPNCQNVHTPQETLDLESFSQIWFLLADVLSALS